MTLQERFLFTPRVVLGLCLASVGALLTFDRLGILPPGTVGRVWPVALIAVGAVVFVNGRAVSRATGSSRRSGGLNGLVLMAIGAWLLLNTLNITTVHFWDLFWPILLIVFGVMLIRQTTRTQSAPGAGSPLTSDDQISVFAVMSGVKRSTNTTHFRGGEITMFMGGCTLDLRQATIPPGGEAVVDVLALMGGAEIAVPPGWVVSTPIVPLMGGVEDKRLPALPTSPELAGSTAPRLVIRGFLMMGGIQIKS